MSAGLLFRLPAIIRNDLAYFGMYKLTMRIGTALVLTALVFKGCMEVYWDKRATMDGFARYNFLNGEVIRLERERVSTG